MQAHFVDGLWCRLMFQLTFPCKQGRMATARAISQYSRDRITGLTLLRLSLRKVPMIQHDCIFRGDGDMRLLDRASESLLTPFPCHLVDNVHEACPVRVHCSA